MISQYRFLPYPHKNKIKAEGILLGTHHHTGNDIW